MPGLANVQAHNEMGNGGSSFYPELHLPLSCFSFDTVDEVPYEQIPRPLTFDNLGEEIQKRIFMYLLSGHGSKLVKEKVHDLDEVTDVDKSDVCEDTSERETEDAYVLQGFVGYYNYELNKFQTRQVKHRLTAGVLYLNHELYKIAQKALYSYNKFILEDFVALYAWLTQIGPQSRKRLRKIEITCTYEPDVDHARGTACQAAMGLLLEADIRWLHFGFDIPAPFTSREFPELEWYPGKEARINKMAKYLVSAVSRIFLALFHDRGITAAEFLHEIFSIHPTSFEYENHLEVRPFLLWEDEKQYKHFKLTTPYSEIVEDRALLINKMEAMLENEVYSASKRWRYWNA